MHADLKCNLIIINILCELNMYKDKNMVKNNNNNKS